VLPVAREVARELANGGPVDDILNLVSKRISHIEKGLSPELEFIAAVNWLGRAPAVNRIEQTPLPECHIGTELKVPDIISVVSLAGKTVPLLIEVKKNSSDKLVWSEKYFNGLQAYGDALKLPILVAWKFHHLWALVDIRHFEKKVKAYHLTLEKAFTENLMSMLFGDLMVELTQRVSFFLDAEITYPAPLPPRPAVLPEGNHTMTIKGAGFLLDGKPVKLSGELTWLFFRAATDHVVERTSETDIQILHTPQAQSVFSLTDFALMLMLWNQDDGNPDWEKVVRDEIRTTVDEVRKQLKMGLDIGVVQYVLEQQPHTQPDFAPR
jgi:Holliday junction resolvase